MIFKLRFWVASLALVSLLVGCGGGGGSTGNVLPNPFDSQCASNAIVSSSATVTIDGFITFDRVPVTSSGLDYSAISQDPVRGITIKACSDEGTYAITKTDDQGFYSLEVPENTELAIAILAEMKSEGSPSWNVSVVDNTNQKAKYAVLGASVNTGMTDSSRIINIPHGSWDGEKYTSPRSAGPYAILDSIYEAMSVVLESNPTANFPKLTVNWSVNNQLVLGGVNVSLGQLSSTSFVPSSNELLVLGKDGQDTDEYDKDIIVHEWVHYYIFNFSRDDTPGGVRYGLLDKLDARVPLSEGLAHAITAVINETNFYRDVIGLSQSLVSQYSVENNNVPAENIGWFSEDSASNFIFDIMDDTAEPGDNIALSFSELNEALLDERFINFSGATTIYTLAEVLRQRNPSLSGEINSLLNGQDITGAVDGFGAGETNDAGDAQYLPLYQTLVVGGSVSLCSDRSNGGMNHLGNRRFARFSIDSPGLYRLSALTTSKESSIGVSNPDFAIYQARSRLVLSNSRDSDEEVLEYELDVGDYWLELYELANIASFQTDSNSKACFDLSLEII